MMIALYYKQQNQVSGKVRNFLGSVQFSRSVVSDSLWPHGLQHARLPCPSPTPGAYTNSCPSSWWWTESKAEVWLLWLPNLPSSRGAAQPLEPWVGEACSVLPPAAGASQLSSENSLPAGCGVRVVLLDLPSSTFSQSIFNSALALVANAFCLIQHFPGSWESRDEKGETHSRLPSKFHHQFSMEIGRWLFSVVFEQTGLLDSVL